MKSFHYRKVASIDVPTETREAAHRALAYARSDLLIPTRDIKWFRASTKDEADFSTDRDIAGTMNLTRADSISIRSDLTPERATSAVWHECGHVAHALGIFDDSDDLEAVARDYASRAAAMYRRDDDAYLRHLGDIRGLGEPIHTRFHNPRVEAALSARSRARAEESWLDDLPADQAEAFRRLAASERKAQRTLGHDGTREFMAAVGRYGRARSVAITVKAKQPCGMKCIDRPGHTCGKNGGNTCATSRTVAIPLERASRELEAARRMR